MTAPLAVSSVLPSVTDVQSEIDRLTQDLELLTKFGYGPLRQNGELKRLKLPTIALTVQGARQLLSRRLVEQQNILASLKPPASIPNGAPVLGPRIEPPKVGINDLTIPLPR